MKILLINPPRKNEIVGNNPAIIDEERGYNPPLGLLYVAAYLEEHTDHKVEIIDAQVEELTYSDLRSRIAKFQPDVAGITAMTMTMIDVLKTIETVKDAYDPARVVLGGPHVHLFPEETARLDGVDYLVLGEGEEVFRDLIEAIDDKKRLRKIQGIAFRSGDSVVNTGVRPAIEDLDVLPFPARHFVPFLKYNSLLSSGEVVTTVFTSRGCPFKCRFCDRPHLGKRFRARSAVNTVDEIEACVEMGIEEFLIYDDTFTVNRGRVIDICDEIKKRGLNIGFDIRARVDTLTGEMLKKLKAAGCQGIHYGVEAGTPKVLKALNKGITLDKAKEVFDLTRRHGIATLAYFMIGNPSETPDDIQTTFQTAKWLNPDYLHLTVLTPFPGTQIYFEALERGIIKKDVWREFAKCPTPAFEPPYWSEYLSREELNQLLIEGYQKFYLRPTYIARRLLKLRSSSELKKKAKAGLKVLGMKLQGRFP
ncbi:MAG: radical SAM protein [Proteobacteria bacterium]|nr:radical SAM protein [Pseudomonadota bacterium]